MMRLGRSFFTQPTLTVAPAMLGKLLVFDGPQGLRQGRIVETEAYVGPEDHASHASRGRTKRTAPMFGPPGWTYVYLIYGMYWCLNFVTEAEGYPAAVLIRALEPLEPTADPRVASGPGKLCRWLRITGTHNQIDATGSVLYLEDDGWQLKPQIVTTPRIGVSYAGPWATKPWRFLFAHHPAVSRPR